MNWLGGQMDSHRFFCLIFITALDRFYDRLTLHNYLAQELRRVFVIWTSWFHKNLEQFLSLNCLEDCTFCDLPMKLFARFNTLLFLRGHCQLMPTSRMSLVRIPNYGG